MIYIYDIILNFNKDYYEFFQWKKSDKILNVKKIPAFKVSDHDLYNFMHNDVIVDKEFISKISDMSSFYSKNDSKFKYMCLFTNGNESIGVLFDKDGKLLKRSSMVFDEEEEVNEELCKEHNIVINYELKKCKKHEFLSRVDKEKIDFLYKYINGLNYKEDSHILKYIYYDYFELEEDDINKIKDEIFKIINFEIDGVDRLYKLVKVLKKIKN